MANASANRKRAKAAAHRLFAIDPENRITVVASAKEAATSGATFASESELHALSVDWPGGRFVEVWNRLPGATAVKKFTNRETAVRRIWKGLQENKPEP